MCQWVGNGWDSDALQLFCFEDDRVDIGVVWFTSVLSIEYMTCDSIPDEIHGSWVSPRHIQGDPSVIDAREKHRLLERKRPVRIYAAFARVASCRPS